MTQEKVEKYLKDFLEAVENEAFVDGHEVLEDAWREWKNDPLTQEESFILKGLINGSTALALRDLGRDEPCKKVWETFEKYRPRIYTINSIYTNLYKEAEALLDEKYKKH